ncbi:DNA mismatch repair protein msh6 [Puccinia graminis f. sp. tritici]|uniref:DNA mismatch repair protein n=1 Tax=Puccinia graminis f. sp. tritici TaxID=56615 RepID=A0A5B0NZH0_PUCGR|nr:DNA mismatch repair protein msh6 [Puccinia graminis f. sp. tritici]KAA1094106.1 DNA mismatch repair protein msh6 [Puccinia graminis f. sp. tritici]
MSSSKSKPTSSNNKLKQSTLGGFFQKSTAPVKSSKPLSSVSRVNDLSSDPDTKQPTTESNHDNEEEEDDGGVVERSRAAARGKRKSIVVAGSSSEDEVTSASRSRVPASKKARYSCASSASGASTPKSFGDGFSSHASTAAPSEADDDEVDDEDEEDKPSSKPKSKASAAKSTKSSSSIAKSKFGQSATNPDKSKSEATGEAPWKQGPWAFLRDIKDADGNPMGSPEYDPRTLFISKKDWASMTPFEVQFWEIKRNHFDTVLFFQKGKFAELYEGDALIGHQEFDLKITKRVKMSMVGVPETSVDFWIAKFLAKGYKVGKVDQCETALGAEMRNKGSLPTSKYAKPPPQQKGSGKEIVRRELRSVVTSGTIVDGNILTDDSATCLLAIKESTNSDLPVFGVIIMDAATAEFNLTHFEDSANRTHLETIMSRFKPKEILHEKSGLSPATLRVLRNTASSDCTWTALKSDEFLEPDECVCRLTELFQESGGQIPQVFQSFNNKLETMQALGGLLWYLKQLNLDKDLLTCKNVKEMDAFRCSRTMHLDGKTISDLELLQSDGSEESRLLKLLNRCVTSFGKRLFRHWLCSPLQDGDAIRARLDAVDFLMNNPSFEEKFSTLSGLPDLERLISRVHAGACTVPNFLKVLKAFEKICSTIQELRQLIDETPAMLLKELMDALPDTDKLLQNLEDMFTLNDDRRELLPLEGKDESYDMALEEEREAEKALKAELKAAKKLLKTDDVVYKDIGIKDIYQIQVSAKVKAPSTWTKMSGTKDCARYYSPQSAQLVKKLKQAREKKSCALKDFHLKVFLAFDENYLIWLQVVKSVAQLDCVLSLAKASIGLGETTCRPKIVDSDEAMVKFVTLRHPCTVGRDDSDFISNDVSVGGDECRMILLTGPNMAGKSTLLRMTCVATILAQIGCYVPAESAVISPVDRICTRMGASDHIFAHASTFKVEMDDARKILKEATSKSLVILDELGRGTSTFDGHAIAFAVLHRLATHSNCLGFFATHYSALTEDFRAHANIATKYMLTNVDEVTREVVFLYKLSSGVSPRSYGPHVAKMAGIPSKIVQRAISISEKFEKETKDRTELLTKQSNYRLLNLVLQADTAFLINLVKNGGFNQPASVKENLNTIDRILLGIQKFQFHN